MKGQLAIPILSPNPLSLSSTPTTVMATTNPGHTSPRLDPASVAERGYPDRSPLAPVTDLRVRTPRHGPPMRLLHRAFSFSLLPFGIGKNFRALLLELASFPQPVLFPFRPPHPSCPCPRLSPCLRHDHHHLVARHCVGYILVHIGAVSSQKLPP